jgi:hypothetical protein
MLLRGKITHSSCKGWYRRVRPTYNIGSTNILHHMLQEIIMFPGGSTIYMRMSWIVTMTKTSFTKQVMRSCAGLQFGAKRSDHLRVSSCSNQSTVMWGNGMVGSYLGQSLDMPTFDELWTLVAVTNQLLLCPSWMPVQTPVYHYVKSSRSSAAPEDKQCITPSVIRD